MPVGPDASNACIPRTSPLIVSVPPLPSATRGEPVALDGLCGRINAGKSLLAYGSNKSVVVRSLLASTSSEGDGDVGVLVYRGHSSTVIGVKFASSGCYVASGDERGKLRVWSYDHEEHLCKYEGPVLGGPIKDISWDGESKRLAVAGGVDAKAECARVLQWDTGVSVGLLTQHIKGRAASVTMKPNRPFRLATGGGEDHRCYFHKGTPFQRIPPDSGIPAELEHTKGAVNRVRYNKDGSMIATVGADKSICIYDGKTMELKSKIENIHSLTIYSCEWSDDGTNIVTASGDGTCKLFEVSKDGTGKLKQIKHWHPAQYQLGKPFKKVPVGGGQLGCTFVNGNMPMSVGLNGQISILPIDDSDPIPLLTGHVAPIGAMAIDHKNQTFYTGDTDGILCKWDLKTGQPLRRLEHPEGNADLMYKVHKGTVSCMAVLADGTMISLGWDDRIYVTKKSGTVQMDPISMGSQPNTVASGGGNLAVILTVNGILLYKNGGLLSSTIMPLSYAALAVCVSADDTTVYVGGDDCKVHVYNFSADKLEEKHVIENGHLKPIHALALSPDGKKLAAADLRDACVYDLTNNYNVLIGKGKWCFHVQRITCLSWSNDSTVLASGGLDNSIFLWSVQNKMRRVHYKYAHRGGLIGLEFLRVGNGDFRFLSVGADSVVNQWNVSKDVTGKLLK